MRCRDIDSLAHRVLAVIVCFSCLLSAPEDSHAFLILAFRGEPCHEKMMLGTLDRTPEPFSSANDISVEPLLQSFVERVGEAKGLDRATEGFVREISARFGLNHYSFAERLVLASFVAGVRAPDTEGLSIIDVNKVREIHIENDQQADHFLRRSSIDGEAWATETITEARRQILDRVARVRAQWAQAGPALERVRWTFAYYGESDVSVFGPAYELGRIAHLIQDSYSHTVRDEEFRILSVANYVDVINENHVESRDGPAHSDRLDRCDAEWSAFDRMRVIEASHSVSEVLSETHQLLMEPARGLGALEGALGAIFAFRSGCGISNGYCDSSWYRVGLEDITQPFSVAVCGTVPRRWAHSSGEPPSQRGVPILGSLPFLLALLFYAFIRFRSAGSGELASSIRIVFLIVLLAVPSQARAFDDPTGGRSFGSWLWNDQFVPTAKIAFDRNGTRYYIAGALMTVFAVRYDDDVRTVFQRHRVLPTEISHIGSFWGSGFPGIAIAATQLAFDQRAGLVHGRALAFTSLNHIALALITRRARPNKDERVSFPSGHTASAFATATALTYSYGWSAGIPAYVMAGLVGTARLHDDVHYMSDVLAAAALGVFWGRASALFDERQAYESSLQVSPFLMDGGAGVVLSKGF